jgi:hypothetical protein
MRTLNKIIFSFIFSVIFSSMIFGGGPVLLVGLDTECGGRVNPATDGSGFHGTINQWCAIYNNMLKQPCVTGNGILVIGGGKSPGDNISTFWNLVSSGTGEPVTFVNGVSNITSQSFTGFRMIAVADAYCSSGGLTQSELNAFNARNADVAAFVNGGGCLFGSTGSPLANQFGYVSSLGTITYNAFAGNIYGSPTMNITTDGIAYGFPSSPYINGPWHNTFLTYPSFLLPLATVSAGSTPTNMIGQTLAIGGMCITIPPPNPVDDCCKDFIRNVSSTVTPYSANPVLNYQVNSTLNIGPNRIRKVEVAMVSLSIKHSNADCQRCFNNPNYWGTIVPIATTSPLVITSLTPAPTLSPINIPAYPGTPFGASYVNYRDFTLGSTSGPGILMSGINQKNMKFLISLQKPSLLQCCTDTIDFCIRYKFTDTTCRVCDTLICYKVVNKGSNTPMTIQKKDEESLEKLMKLFKNNPEGQGYPGTGSKKIFKNISGILDTLLSCRSTGKSSVKVVLLNRTKLKLTLFDANRNLIKELDEQFFNPDEYTFDFADYDLPEGEYSVKIETEEGIEERRFYWKEVPTCPCKKIKQEQEESVKRNKY